MFTATDISTRLRGQPFTPVRIVTTTGETYDVTHSDLVVVTRRFLEVGMPSEEGPSIAEQVTRIAIIHVTELRDLPGVSPPNPPSANSTPS
ncbi:MAG: hypothetical protein ACJ8F7_09355 [Gemmataceae bacterium]